MTCHVPVVGNEWGAFTVHRALQPAAGGGTGPPEGLTLGVAAQVLGEAGPWGRVLCGGVRPPSATHVALPPKHAWPRAEPCWPTIHALGQRHAHAEGLSSSLCNGGAWTGQTLTPSSSLQGQERQARPSTVLLPSWTRALRGLSVAAAAETPAPRPEGSAGAPRSQRVPTGSCAPPRAPGAWVSLSQTTGL